MQNMAKKHSYIDAASYCDRACNYKVVYKLHFPNVLIICHSDNIHQLRVMLCNVVRELRFST